MSHNGHQDLDTAEAVFDRVLANLEGRPAAPQTNGHTPPKETRVRLTQVRSAAARTLDLYGELFQRAFETYADLAQAALQPGTDPAPDTPLALAGRAGGEAVTPLWLHNVSNADVHAVKLFVTDLTAPTGNRIRASRAAVTPAVLDIGAGASASAQLRIRIPAQSTPGVYHGHVLAATLPTSALGVRLEVEP